MQPARGLTTQQVEDLVSYVIGTPWTSPASGPLPLPAKPISACNAKASCRATVARWVRAERLAAKAVPGAKIVAIAGCLSCHRYAGTGVKTAAAPDLTRAGLAQPTVTALVRRLRCPTCVRRGSVMPSYKAFGDANLALVAAFLRASRGVRT
jgi:cytochrome c553